MPQLIFEGNTHSELVAQVRAWLASMDENPDGTLSMSDAITQGAGLTKDALRIIATAAPAPVAQNDVVKALTDMGYKVTDATSKAMVDGLQSVEALTGGSIVEQVSDRGRSTLWSMNQKVAKQVLRTLAGN
ncbi:MAG: hypothetical protein MUE36_15060 [Acidimicrobiales bacterium]|jgi:hypothetical protein|nr:hypothetical protein [Acidimicrobiales bacterium]